MDNDMTTELDHNVSSEVQSNDLPRTLVLCVTPWVDGESYQTYSSFFKTWSPSRVGVLYQRNELPNSSVCDNFFQISENETLWSVLNPTRKVGRVVPAKSQSKKETEQNKRKKVNYDFYAWKNSYFRPFFELARELVWLFGNWKTEKLNDFINDFDPEVVLVPINPAIYSLRTAKYIIKVAQKPVVTYFLDDSYTYKSVKKTPGTLLKRWVLRKYVRWIVAHSSQVAVIVPKQKEVYDVLFGIDSTVLTQFVDYSKISYSPKICSSPIRMVYTGSLSYGRWNTLILLAKALGKINVNGIKITLDVYTQYKFNNKQKKLINRNGCRVVGSVPHSVIAKIQSAADVLLFAESLERRYRNTAYLSFSTKITDYLASGRCIFAVGSRDIAPIEYLEHFDSAIIASSFNEIVEKLQTLVDNPGLLAEYGKRAYQCGLTRHNKELMESRFQQTLKSAVLLGTRKC